MINLSRLGHSVWWISFASANFIALRRSTCHFMWLVEWLHRRVIPGEGKTQDEERPTRWYFWRVLGPIARAWSLNSKFCLDRSICPYHGLVLSWYHGWPLPNNRVIKTNASTFMTPKISKSWKLEILLAHDQFARSGINFDQFRSLARISLLCGAPRVISCDS